jgi:hypothetical protein
MKWWITPIGISACSKLAFLERGRHDSVLVGGHRLARGDPFQVARDLIRVRSIADALE